MSNHVIEKKNETISFNKTCYDLAMIYAQEKFRYDLSQGNDAHFPEQLDSIAKNFSQALAFYNLNEDLLNLLDPYEAE
ncbi:MAG: hypothetical protein II992_00205 [Lachnospiraceae bacterium]|nr:hypothetical protein [Lachnospiraceae bacterium]